MSERTGIAWTDSTWSPLLGCTATSPGCARCYALRDVWRMAHNPNAKISGPRKGLVEKSGGRLRWTGKVSLVHEQLRVPIRWRKPRRIFVVNQSDLFHPDVPFDFVDEVWGVMAACECTTSDGGPSHTFQVLTKRPERLREYLSTDRRLAWARAAVRYGGGENPDPLFDQVDSGPTALPHVWLGTSVENQAAADERIPELLGTPAALRFLSCEPLLGPVDLERAFAVRDGHGEPSGPRCNPDGSAAIGWVICGGESGQLARPCEEAWIRSIVEQCKAAGVPCFVKQLGTVWARSPRTDEAFFLGGGHQAGADPEEWPEDLRVQEMPEVSPCR